MNYFVIPIVYGGADYTKFAPPYSYINANAFATVKELADYLSFLDKNPKEYIKYFWWKKYYQVAPGRPFPFCKLCEILNQPIRDTRVRYYQNLFAWWYQNTCYEHSFISF